MRLIFIRHGDPDYVNDSVTTKGERELLALQRRVQRWLAPHTVPQAANAEDSTFMGASSNASPMNSADVFDFYVSPLGRARRTAEIALYGTGRKAEVLPWLPEFFHPVEDPVTGKQHNTWDWLPSWYADEERAPLRDVKEWMNTPVMKSGKVAEYYKEVCEGIDLLLLRYGYCRDEVLHGVYRTDGKHCQPYKLEKSTDTFKDYHDNRVAVFFCHLGVMFAAISHLLNMSPMLLWQSFFVAPASLTILGSEEREPGIASFRVQALGDTSHLHDAGEHISASGYFTDVFEG